MTSEIAARTAGESDDRSLWTRLREDVFEGEDLAAIVVTVLLVVIALFASLVVGLSRSAGSETVSGTLVVPAEAGSLLTVSRESVPDTELSLQGNGTTSARPQRVVVLDEEVLFGFDSADLRDNAAAELERVVALIRASGDAPIEVVGYTDAEAPEEYNLPLSRDRAQAVADYLSSLGIDAQRLVVDWRGEAEPAASNSNPFGRRLNRRVEIRIDDGSAPVTVAPAGSSTDRTPEGSQLVVHQVRVTPTAASANITFTNAAPFPVELADRDIWLLDDTGYSYRFVPSWQNPVISVPAGATLTGWLVFPGVVPATTTTFTMITNSREPIDDLARPDRESNDPTPMLVVSGAPAVRPVP